MGKNRRTIIITFSALVLTGIISQLLRSTEPTYQGKNLSQWLYEYNDELQQMGTFRPDAPELVDSTRAIKAIGTNGIPTLLKLLQAHDIKGSQQLESFVRRLGWKTFEITHAKEKWNLADRGFILLGNDAKSAAPILVNILKASPPETAPYILSSLVEIQSPREIALPVLIEQLSNTNRDIRWYGAYFLHKLYPEEAEKAGVYNLFPKFRPHSTNAPAVNK